MTLCCKYALYDFRVFCIFLLVIIFSLSMKSLMCVVDQKKNSPRYKVTLIFVNHFRLGVHSKYHSHFPHIFWVYCFIFIMYKRTCFHTPNLGPENDLIDFMSQPSPTSYPPICPHKLLNQIKQNSIRLDHSIE